MDNRELLNEWRYKDGDRYWWRAQIWKSGERSTNLPNEDSMDFEWDYSVEREDGQDFRIIQQGRIIGQYEDRPELREVLTDFMGAISGHVIAFAIDGHEMPVTGERE